MFILGIPALGSRWLSGFVGALLVVVLQVCGFECLVI